MFIPKKGDWPSFYRSLPRFCGLSLARLGSARSSGKAASRWNARAMIPGFSRRTISSPRREISTSLLFRRNCFGKRTAWLFPERKTFAVAIFQLPLVIAMNWPAMPVPAFNAAHCTFRQHGQSTGLGKLERVNLFERGGRSGRRRALCAWIFRHRGRPD